MASININNMNETQAVGNQEAADVKGGAIYIHIDGIDGDSTHSKATPILMQYCADGKH